MFYLAAARAVSNPPKHKPSASIKKKLKFNLIQLQNVGEKGKKIIFFHT